MKEFDRMLRRAWRTFDQRQAALQRDYGLGTYPRFDWNKETGMLVFSDAGVPRLLADIQFVGTLSLVSRTWLWAWANQSLDERLALDAGLVRELGERGGYPKLTKAQWRADENDAWEMTALQLDIAGAQGAYRAPGAHGVTFMTLKNVRWPEAVH